MICKPCRAGSRAQNRYENHGRRRNEPECDFSFLARATYGFGERSPHVDMCNADPKTHTHGLALATFFTLLAGCMVSPHSMHAHYGGPPPPADWQEVRLSDSSMRLRMPAQPQLEESSEADFDGTIIRSTVGRYIAGNMILGFSVISADGGFIEDPFEKASSAATSSSGHDQWNVRWEKEYSRDGFLAADRIVDNSAAGATIRFHFVQGRTKIYALFAAYPTSQEAQSQWWVDEFLRAASYAPREALSPHGDGRLSWEDWGYIFPPEREFAVEIPGAPSTIALPDRLSGLDAETHSYGVSDESDGLGFKILVHEFARGVPEEAIARARGVTGAGYDVVSETYVHQRGYPGVDVKLKSATHVLYAQYFVTKGRVYEMLSWSPLQSATEHAAARRRFLHTFRIL